MRARASVERLNHKSLAWSFSRLVRFPRRTKKTERLFNCSIDYYLHCYAGQQILESFPSAFCCKVIVIMQYIRTYIFLLDPRCQKMFSVDWKVFKRKHEN